MSEYDIDIDSFCDHNKESTCSPFSIGDFTYSTNGWVCIRVRRLDYIDELEKAPPVLRLQWDHNDIGNWIVAPELTEPQTPCKMCKGTGNVCVCPECNGEGEVIAETHFNEYEVTCATCDGDGQIEGSKDKCSACDGTGNSLDNIVRWDRGFIHARHLVKIKELPCVEVSTHGEETDVIRFRFHGGVGIVMPARG